MADLGSSIKELWIRSMEAIGNTASNIASNTRSRVDEMNLVNRRAEILKDFGNQAYALWQQGERFPEIMEQQLKELQKLDESLNDLRAERLAGVKVESEKPDQEENPAEIPSGEASTDSEAADDTLDIGEEEDHTLPVIEVESAEEPGADVNDAISTLFDKVPSSRDAAEKVTDVLDSLESGLKEFSNQIDQTIDGLSERLQEEKPKDSE